MESQPQPSESDVAQFPNTVAASEPASLLKLSSATQTQEKTWRRVGAQASNWLAQLPENLGRFWNEYKTILTSVALILTAFITLRIVLAVMNALNGIPLLEQTFQLVGISYCAWFVYRYLLTKSSRQELFQIIQGFLDK